MSDIAKITDGVAICISDRSLFEMGREAAQRLEAHVKQTITDAGMRWTLQRDDERMELRIIPVALKEGYGG
jgi:hypothetical protein